MQLCSCNCYSMLPHEVCGFNFGTLWRPASEHTGDMELTIVCGSQNKNVPVGVGGRGRAVAARAKAKAAGAP